MVILSTDHNLYLFGLMLLTCAITIRKSINKLLINSQKEEIGEGILRMTKGTGGGSMKDGLGYVIPPLVPEGMARFLHLLPKCIEVFIRPEIQNIIHRHRRSTDLFIQLIL